LRRKHPEKIPTKALSTTTVPTRVPIRLGGEDRQSQAESINPNSKGWAKTKAPVEPARAENLLPPSKLI